MAVLSLSSVLPEQELLSTIAEMGIGIVGFAVVADILRSRSTSDVVRLYNLRDVAEIGLMIAVLSVFPSMLHGLGLSAEASWRTTGGGVLVWTGIGVASSFRRRGPASLVGAARSNRLVSVIVYMLIGLNLALAFSNLVGAGPSSGARHVAWALSALGQAGTMFISSVFSRSAEVPATQ